MYARHRIGVIIPVGTAGRSLPDTLASIPHYMDRIYLLHTAGSDPGGGASEPTNPRIRHVQTGYHASVDSALGAVYRYALDDGMDVVVRLDSRQPIGASSLSYLLDPIVWGEADYAKLNYTDRWNGDLPAGPSNHHAVFVSQVRSASHTDEFVSLGNGTLAVSRPALESHWGRTTTPASGTQSVQAASSGIEAPPSRVALSPALPSDIEGAEESLTTAHEALPGAIPEAARSPASQPRTRNPEPRYRHKKVAVVIPAHNEEVLIGATLESIPDFICRIYVVNDCSGDRTQEIVEAYATRDPRIVLVCHEVNSGVGAAIATGYREALKEGMDIVAVMDGDNQMDPAFLPRLLDPIVEGKVDYTKGNRLISPAYRKGMTSWRFTGNAALTLLTKIASGYWQMMDPQNGYTAISTRALERLDLYDIYPRYGYCNDLLVKLNANNFKIQNIPVPARYGKEKSGIRYGSYIVKVSRLLLKDFIWRLKFKYLIMSFHPLVFYYLLGTILSVLGIVGGLVVLFEKFILGYPVLFVHGTLSLVVFTLGAMFFLFAMLFDMQNEKSESSGWY